MSGNKWVRSISFNRTNEKDIKRLKFIGRRSFSKFVKNLIDKEMKRNEEQNEVVVEDKKQSYRYDQKKEEKRYNQPLLLKEQKPQRNTDPKR